MLQHSLKPCIYLLLKDVGAVINRPRATNSRPYEFYR